MCPNQFQSQLLFLDLPNRIFFGKVEKNGDKASPCFRPFWVGNSDKCLLTWNSLEVSIKHILNSLISFMGTPNSIRILYNTSLLTQAYALLMSMNSCCNVSLYSQAETLLRVLYRKLIQGTALPSCIVEKVGSSGNIPFLYCRVRWLKQ
jgi:hypothetical protein